MQSAGMTTLASKLEATKLALEQFEVAKSQAGLAYNQAANIDKLNVVAQHVAIIKSWCSSRFAAQLGCANLPGDLTGRRQ
ncbi:MAG: hypothetical protein EPO50_28985 [Reyranella sp.]|nr:MAG: hypothetical protein EPO50_28985 [Reyranella sp.]